MQITFPATSPDDIRLENKNGAGKSGATVWKQTPLTAGRAKRNAGEWSCRGS